MRFAVIAGTLALAAFVGCDQVLDIQDHHLALDAGADGGSSSDSGSSSEAGSSSGGDAGCKPCVLDTATLDNCCVQ
jgi:hypothetical protein